MKIAVLKVYEIDNDVIESFIQSEIEPEEIIEKYIMDNFGDDFLPGPGYNNLIEIVKNEKRSRSESIK